MSVDDETLFAFIDGELPPEEMERVAIAVAADERLAARVERHHRLAAEARADLDRDLADPLPDAWIAAIDARLDPGSNVASLAVARVKRRSWLPTGAAVAASLAAGLGIGATMLAPAPALVAERQGALAASSELALALDGARSGEARRLASGGAVTVKLSLRGADGEYCRDAAIAGRSSYRVLACRGGPGWEVRALTREVAEEGGYRQAGGDSLIDGAVDALGGEVLDADGEAAAVRKRWRD